MQSKLSENRRDVRLFYEALYYACLVGSFDPLDFDLTADFAFSLVLPCSVPAIIFDLVNLLCTVHSIKVHACRMDACLHGYAYWLDVQDTSNTANLPIT